LTTAEGTRIADPQSNDGHLLRNSPIRGILRRQREARTGDFIAKSQVPWGLDALNGEATKPAWKSKPSWYLVATNDKMIPVPAQRMMADRADAKTTDQAGSHAVYVSQPDAVAAIIEGAAPGRRQVEHEPCVNTPSECAQHSEVVHWKNCGIPGSGSEAAGIIRRLSRLNAPAPKCTICRRPPAIIRFLRK